MLAQKDESIDAAVDTAFRLMSDEAIRERVFAREDYYRNQRSLERWAESQRLKAEENRKRAEDAEAELLRLRELLRKSGLDTELDKK